MLEQLGDKPLEKLSKTAGQLPALGTSSTGSRLSAVFTSVLYAAKGTGFNQPNSQFTQAVLGDFNRLSLSLYPSSTGPITNTKLNIKELYL